MGQRDVENIENRNCNSYFIITKKFLTVSFWYNIWKSVADARRVILPSYAHTMVKPPDPIRTPKLSTIGPAQYCGGGPRGNRRWCTFLLSQANEYSSFLSPAANNSMLWGFESFRCYMSSYSVVVSTSDSNSEDLGSNPSRRSSLWPSG